jgi:plasmid maintenance system antidote protein VapI
MKYRILQVFDTDIEVWYRLQKSADGVKWEHVTSDSNLPKLTATMKRLAECKEPVLIEEIET